MTRDAERLVVLAIAASPAAEAAEVTDAPAAEAPPVSTWPGRPRDARAVEAPTARRSIGCSG